MAKKTEKENLLELTWRAAEYQYVEKDAAWYLIVVTTALVLIILSLVQKNFFFAIFVLIAAVMIVFFARRRPQVVDFRVTEKGIAIGENVFYDYDRLEGFRIIEKPGRLNEVVLKKKAMVNPYFKLPIDAKSAALAGKILENHLPPIQYEESLLDVVSDWFGF